jgi:hypothetical protein
MDIATQHALHLGNKLSFKNAYCIAKIQHDCIGCISPYNTLVYSLLCYSNKTLHILDDYLLIHEVTVQKTYCFNTINLLY